jgi:hypothetical protein
MFEYALARHLALRNNTDIRFDIESYKTNLIADCSFWLETFTIDVRNRLMTSAQIESFKRLAPRPGKRGWLYNPLFADPNKYILEQHYHFDPTVVERKGDIYLHGWWQSEKYFSTIREILLEDFVLRIPMAGYQARVAEHIQSSNSIAMHVRRLDYVTNPRTRKFHGQLPTEYYREAAERIARQISNPVLFVFSDDPESVQRELDLPYEMIFVEKGSSESGAEDMILMSLCKHNIIANSSFSWWGAWLNRNPKKMVVGPSPWFANRKSDTSDVLPVSWGVLPAHYITE